MIGEQVEIVVERSVEEAGGYRVSGMSERFLRVRAAGRGAAPEAGRRVLVTVQSLHENTLLAQVDESAAVPVA
jgi:hypothetical protein